MKNMLAKELAEEVYSHLTEELEHLIEEQNFIDPFDEELLNSSDTEEREDELWEI